MKTAVATKSEAPAGVTPKDVIGRLLDLVAGWARYVEEDEAEHPDILSRDEIGELYQSIPAYFEPYWEAPDEIKEAVALRFVYERLLPLLLKRQSKD